MPDPLGHVFVSQSGNQNLQVGGPPHILPEGAEQTVMAPFKAGKAHPGKFPQLVKQIERHLFIEYPHISQVAAQTVAVPRLAIQRRAAVSGEQADQVVHQPVVRHKIPFKPEGTS